MAHLPKGQGVIPMPPFMSWLSNNVPAVYDNTMSYYEELCSLIKYLQDIVVPAVNHNAEALTTVSEALEQLKQYVDNYFANLDVQEEINNKLDQMADDGTLQEIITAYIQANVAWTFDSVADMKSATNLVAGSYARTLGFHSLNDGGGATYYITDSGSADEMAVIAIGDLYANIVLPSVATPEMFGAYGDKSNDDTASFDKCLSLCKVIEANKEYLITDDLHVLSGTTLYGKGTIYQPNNYASKLINIYEAENIVIDSLTICNESSQSGTPASYGDQFLMYIEKSKYIEIKNCHFKNAYKRGIEVKESSEINYHDNTFKNATYDMLFLHPLVENVKVENSIFDGITSTLPNAYLFCTGGEDNVTVFDFPVRNVLVNNCKFLNNTLWEGIDTHACINFTCTNNYVENCYRGIMAKYDGNLKLASAQKNDNLVIKDNIIVGGTYSTTSAIIAGGNANYFAKNITIEGNKISKCGQANSYNNASIDVAAAKYVNIIRNEVTDSNGVHVTTTNVTYGNVCENKLINCGYETGLAIYQGSWYINVKNNIIRNLITNKVNGIRTEGIANIEGNDIEGFTRRFYGNYTNMYGTISAGTTEMGKAGNYIRNTYQLITHYCTDDVVRAKSATTMGFTATINNGSNEVETSARYTYNLCEGQEIVIAGAGSGEDLTTIISEVIDERHFKVKDIAGTGVSGASISTTAGTWVAV